MIENNWMAWISKANGTFIVIVRIMIHFHSRPNDYCCKPQMNNFIAINSSSTFPAVIKIHMDNAIFCLCEGLKKLQYDLIMKTHHKQC